MREDKIGLALGGGGARGLAHIGVLKVLVRESIPIHIVAGTSMGGVIGALFAAGIPMSEIEVVALSLRKLPQIVKLVDLRLIGRGFIKGARIYRYLASALGEDLTFADLKIPLALVAVDLETGCEVTLWQGKVVDAVRATLSVPGVFEPVRRDEMLLTDGGILNNVPVDTVRKMGARKVIAVDVLPDFHPNIPGKPPLIHPLRTPLVNQPLQDMSHAIMIMISEITREKLIKNRPDVIIRPPLPREVHLFTGFERAPEIIAAGEAITEEMLPQIKRILG